MLLFPSNIWCNSAIKAQVSGIFIMGEMLIMNSICLTDIMLFRFSSSSYVSFGKLHLWRNLSMPSNLSRWWHLSVQGQDAQQARRESPRPRPLPGFFQHRVQNWRWPGDHCALWRKNRWGKYSWEFIHHQKILIRDRWCEHKFGLKL